MVNLVPKRHVLFWLGWIFAVAVIVHLDWHLGRPHHIPLSLGFPHHWILGLITGAALAWHATRADPQRATRLFILIGALGLFAGQILEPLGEVIVYDADTLTSVLSPFRWRLFGQFAIAFVVGGASVLIAHQRRAQTAALS
jgi:hypothetical protein